ncbi:unnamed protein product [Didymodactylos carnosus]|uniref:TIR domain-containing protein n=1 Tax=Didymodactylos carnosus TaxID=1234261 RepID=A0A814K917_9BILA|nr:unnamed protein product [Didymodactylos carnosus]CAF3819047.1 unnamed protein product [Didymodactylos carnosus]
MSANANSNQLENCFLGWNKNESPETLCEIIRQLTSFSSQLKKPNQISHEIFSNIITVLTQILNKWLALSEQEIRLFKSITDLLSTMITAIDEQNVAAFKHLLLTKPFIKSISAFLEHILPKLSTVNCDVVEGVSKLLFMLDILQYDRPDITDDENLLTLLDPVMKCICSINYFTILTNLTASTTLTIQEEFLVITCSYYFSRYRGIYAEKLTNKLGDIMLKRFEQVLCQLTQTVSNWNESMMKAVQYISYVLRRFGEFDSTRKRLNGHLKIIDSIMMILNSSHLHHQVLKQEQNVETTLIYTAIWVLSSLENDSELTAYIKANHNTQTFMTLTNAKYKPIQTYAYKILAVVMNEDDIKQSDDPGKITTVFIDFIKQAVDSQFQSSPGGKLTSLLYSLRALVQHDQIKREIVTQEGIHLLIKCATDSKFNVFNIQQRALEIIWSMTFLDSAAIELRDASNHQFISYLKAIISSNSSNVRRHEAAVGIIWKLKNKADFSIATAEKTTSNEEYDIMLSYSHQDKELCYKIHKYLIDKQLRVWLDRDHMYGSTIQAMANAIEKSKCVLLCMSELYKTSPSCQSEAEFAHKTRRPIIPIIMREKYRPDGWLSFIAGSRIYIDYPKLGFQPACDKLIEDIHKQKSSTPLNHQHEPPLPLTSNTSCVQQWSYADVLHFIDGANLSAMKPLLGKVDGQELFELYKMCELNSQQMYESLKTELFTLNNEILPINVYLRFINQLRKEVNG